MMAVDFETTGVDLNHLATPFMFTTCDENDDQLTFEWDVNPLTRQVVYPPEDIDMLADIWRREDLVIFQNPKFDIKCFDKIGVFDLVPIELIWEKIRDTLLGTHLLRSDQAHDLTTSTLIYLDVNIQTFEDTLKRCVTECRRFVKTQFPDWLVAKAGVEGLPSAAGEEPWKFDMWLPKAYAKAAGLPEDHIYYTACSDYARADTWSTLHLWKVVKRLLEEMGLWEIYAFRLKTLPVIYDMESVGLTLNKDRLDESREKYRSESAQRNELCMAIAAETYDYELTLPKSGNNKSLTKFVFDVMQLPPKERSKKTGEPSLKAEYLKAYLSEFDEDSVEYKFCLALREKRQRDTAVSYMDSYERYWQPFKADGIWFILYPSLNSTGTSTLRFSSSSPNEQNISKKEGFNLRYLFGPAPGRVWYSMDANNIELRIPAYESGEQLMIDLFEKPDEGPYYGSNHLLFAHAIHDNECDCEGCLDTQKMYGLGMFESCKNEKGEVDGRAFKKRYATTWYQWTKNGNFAVQYGAQESSGTADRAYHVVGAQAKTQKKLGKIAALNLAMIDHAQEFGYVETIPDKTVDPERGYPLYAKTNWRGEVKPTIPLSYHVQGTAMWWMTKAMVRTWGYFQELNAQVLEEAYEAKKLKRSATRREVKRYLRQHGYFLIMQIHDEIIFELPKKKNPRANMPVLRKLRSLMRMGGDDIGIPIEVGCEYHPNNWSEGETVQFTLTT